MAAGVHGQSRDKLQSFLRGLSAYCDSLADEAVTAAEERKHKTDASHREFSLLIEKLRKVRVLECVL